MELITIPQILICTFYKFCTLSRNNDNLQVKQATISSITIRRKHDKNYDITTKN